MKPTRSQVEAVAREMYSFRNSLGAIIQLPAKTTIKDLVKMGLTFRVVDENAKRTPRNYISTAKSPATKPKKARKP